MIPLSKPLINFSKERECIDNFVRFHFNNRHYHLAFSARQGLWEIYRNLKREKGRQTVAVSPLTCVEALYPIIENGHEILFVDINPETLNMYESLIPKNIDVVQAIHFGGNPQNMNLIQEKNPSILIEDCAQGFGSSFNNIPVGMFGDYASFSFMKNLYSLGGGLVLSKKTMDPFGDEYKKFNIISTSYRYFKRSFENNCKIKDNFSSLLLKTILKLKPENTSAIIKNASSNMYIINSIEKQIALYNEIKEKRIISAQFLLKKVNNPSFVPQKIIESGTSNYLRLLFVLKNNTTSNVVKYMRKYGIGANHITQNYLNPYQERFDKNEYLKKYIIKSNLENYFNLHDRIISIPISPSLSIDDLNYVARRINKFRSYN